MGFKVSSQKCMTSYFLGPRTALSTLASQMAVQAVMAVSQISQLAGLVKQRCLKSWDASYIRERPAAMVYLTETWLV